MTAQDNVALSRMLLDLYNSHQSDPAWLEKIVAHLAKDCETIDVPTGRMLRGPEGYKQTALFFADGFPDSKVEITNVFAQRIRASLNLLVVGPTQVHCICQREIFHRRVDILRCGSAV